MKPPSTAIYGQHGPYGQTYVSAPAPSAKNHSATNTQKRANTQVRPYGKYDPAIHHRRSIRLQGYDYSQAGAYFVTICSQNRQCLFGEIVNGELRLNDAGEMICRWYEELGNKFPDIECDAFVCMPNHVHFVVVNVGADLCVRPGSNSRDLRVRPDRESAYHPKGQTHRSAPTTETDMDKQQGEHTGSPLQGSPLQRVVQWFKTMSTNEYIRGVKQCGWSPFPGKLWQRNYWEHIIRNESELNRIREYIHNNPAQWEMDKLFVRADLCVRPDNNAGQTHRSNAGQTHRSAPTGIREPFAEYGVEAWMA